MAQEIVNEDRSFKQLKASYGMYEATKKETARKMKEKLNPDGTKRYTEENIKKEMDLLTEAQNDIVSQYVMLGGKEEDIRKTPKKKKSNEESNPFIATTDLVRSEASNAVSEEIRKIDAVREMKAEAVVPRMDQSYIPPKGAYSPDETFDVIPLPSKGEGYADKIAKMSVAFLTAYDENKIVSPNLYRDNLIIDYLLEEKILSKEIEPIDLLEGDRDAIILFLRASSYGNMFPIKVTDDKTGEVFETNVDLAELKYRDFNLVGDSKGWFSCTLPVSQKEVKFRFPTHRDNVILKKLHDNEELKVAKSYITRCVERLDELIENDNAVGREEKVKIRQSIRNIENWADNMDEDDTLKYNHDVTNRLMQLIMSVDGITDRGYISEFVKRMNVKDSRYLRLYINKNEPGIDYNITVQRPESLGGGSMNTFLQLDQFLFLNIPE